MTTSTSCNLIDYSSYRRDKGLALFYNIQSTAQSPAEQMQIWNSLCCVHKAGNSMDFDCQLRALENSARHNLLKIYKKLSTEPLAGYLQQLLAERILPTLDRIGCEQTISKMLFEIAPSAWKLMGRADKIIIPFHPLIDREIKMVQKGLKSKFDQNGNNGLPSSADWSGCVPGSIKYGNFPEQLFDVLDDIATPWIILPRAFRFMEKSHCRYLPVYIKILDAEDSGSCLKLFSRITVEFIANFSFKFADRRHPSDQLSKLLFYGYAALYWKTLRCPPKNLENSAVFYHYLNWLSRFARQNKLLGKAEKAMVDQMIKMKAYAFPAINTKSYRNTRQPDSARFLVALRHGTPGAAATLRHFGIDQFLKTRRSGNRFTCLSFQKELLGLLYQIRTHYHSESKHTRENIKNFINKMKAASHDAPPDFNRTQQQFVYRLLNEMQKFVSS